MFDEKGKCEMCEIEKVEMDFNTVLLGVPFRAGVCTGCFAGAADDGEIVASLVHKRLVASGYQPPVSQLALVAELTLWAAEDAEDSR